MKLWVTVYEWMNELNQRIDRDYLKNSLVTHPDYPALSSLTDFLDSGGLKYWALRTRESQAQNFNYPLLAHIKMNNSDFLIQVRTYEEWQKSETLKENWTGIVLFTENNSKWRNKEHSLIAQKRLRFNLVRLLAGSIGLFFLFFGILNNSSLLYDIWGVAGFMGMLFSLLIIQTELGVQDQLTRQICNAVNHNGCTAVLKSKYSQGVFGLTVGDMVLVYFIGQFIFWVISVFELSIQPVILSISLAGIPAALVSIFVQKYKIKRWCGLCLLVVAVLILQSVTAILKNTFTTSVWLYVSVLLAFLISGIFYSRFRKLLQNNELYKKQVKIINNWEKDFGLFQYQLENGPVVNCERWEHEILLGNENSPIQMTVACNAYCGPCSKMHRKIDEMLEVLGNEIGVSIRFLCDRDRKNNDPLTQAVEYIFKVHQGLEKGEVRKMLSDWFEDPNLNRFQQKWPIKVDCSVDKELDKNKSWMKEANISSTPRIFINNKRLPFRYGFEELIYFISRYHAQMGNNR